MGVSSIEYALQAKPAKKPKLMQSSGTSCNCAENASTQRGNMCEKGCTTCHKVRPLDLGGATKPSLPVTCPLLPVPQIHSEKTLYYSLKKYIYIALSETKFITSDIFYLKSFFYTIIKIKAFFLVCFISL